jgi:chaperonin GroES
MLIIPVGNRILVKPNEREEKTKSGLILAGGEDEKQDQGIIMGIGDGEEVKRFTVGDIVVYQKFGPAEIKIDKEKYVIINLDEILGIIKED